MESYETTLSNSFDKNFDRILPVYLLPDPIRSKDKALEDIIAKAQAVISEKNISNYLDEAYMLQGRANFYQDLHFSAVEYFNYVAKAFDANTQRKLNALNWKARSEMQLDKLSDAQVTINSITDLLTSLKRGKAEAHATVSQFHILNGEYDLAIQNLQQALKQKNTSFENDRWEYILAQLFSLENQPIESLKYFTKVARSNSSFDLYFNANLNKIKLESQLSGDSLNQHKKILALLKEDKNDGYQDQIYFKVAELFALSKNFPETEFYLKQSISSSTNNQYQKGLSFLTLANFYFGNKNDYLNAKLYYDSALTALPKNYQGLELIQKKVNNLAYLSDRFIKVAFQDSLQILATLPEAQWEPRIQKILGPEKVAIALTSGVILENTTNLSQNNTNLAAASSFYFSSPAAVSSGFTDFKRRWGNRPLEDNWRQSAKQSGVIAQNVINDSTNPIQNTQTTTNASRDAEVKRYIENIPNTPQKKLASDQIIQTSLFEIASFYQYDLEDLDEAIKIYEDILRRYPNTSNNGAIYFSLYRAYGDNMPELAEKYKNLVLTNFPNSNYAKAILDPTALAREGEIEIKVQELYNNVYLKFEEKAYPALIKEADSILSIYPTNNIRSQYDYLKAIAIGRTHTVDTLLEVFNALVQAHPADSVVTPLVKEHIDFIQANLGLFKNREFALLDFDINDPRFLAQNTVAPIRQQVVPTPQPTRLPPIVSAVDPPKLSGIEKNTSTVATNQYIPPVSQTNVRLGDTSYIEPVKTSTIGKVQNPVTRPIIGTLEKPKAGVVEADKVEQIVNDGTFDNAPSNLYYYVVAVDDAVITLSSSRFGLGQFNRSNYSDENLRHLLKELEEDQLIFVGNFADLESVRNYNNKISSQVSTIMKIPASRYKTFIISKENFDKLTSRSRILQYITFFSTNINEKSTSRFSNKKI